MAGADDVPHAIVLVTQERPAAVNARRSALHGRDAGVGAFRIAFRAAVVVIRLIPIGTPFPGVAGHVIKAVAVRWEGRDGGEAFVTVFVGVVIGERSLPDVG